MEVNVNFLPYMEKKKAKHGEMSQVDTNSNFRDSYLNIEKEFHYTVKDFFA